MLIEQTNTSQTFFHKIISNFWRWFALLFVAVLFFHGKPVPFSNEFLYLLRLEPNFLPNDWTFSQSPNEHWLFNILFSFPAYVFSLETVGWAGRIIVWTLCLIGLMKIAKLWEIPFWAIAIAIFVWLAFAQAVVNDEWIFGGFEAKTVAYSFLIFSLYEFCRKKIILPSILLGFSFSFHPAVGLWAIPAVGLALLFEKIQTKDFVKVVFLTFFFSLLGLTPLLLAQTSVSANSFEDWKFIVIYRVPWHLDIFQFDKRGLVAIFAMLSFNIFALLKNENFALRFLLKFQIALGLFFIFGVLLRWLELYPLLRLMPMRLFPIITPLFFLFTVFYYFAKSQHSRITKFIVLIFVLGTLYLVQPLHKGISQLNSTIETWKMPQNDLEKTSIWLSNNTPKNAVIIQPPQSREAWYFSKRANILSYSYPTYDRLAEWRERVADLTDNVQITKGEFGDEEVETAFNKLTQENIEVIRKKYKATHLVSRNIYSYPIIFETETYKVYQLPEINE